MARAAAASEHLHGGPCLQAPAGGQGDRLRTMQGDVREEPAVGGDPRRGGAFGRADQQRRRLVDGPLAGVPDVVGEGEGTVARPGGGDVGRSARLGEGGIGIRLGGRVEAGPQAGDLVALGLGAQPLGGAERVLNHGVLLDRGQDDAGGDLDRCDEVGRSAEDLVGRRGPPRRSRRHRRAPTPAPRPPRRRPRRPCRLRSRRGRS